MNRNAGVSSDAPQRQKKRLRSRVFGLLTAGAIAATGLLATGPAIEPAHALPFQAEKKIETCSTGVTGFAKQSVDPRQVNLVLDDSGSMFVHTNPPYEMRQRWSNAKYSLEVFAAMLAPNDQLNVYLTSQFQNTAEAAPMIQMNGTESLADRVNRVHAMQLGGGNTPYAPVQQAAKDITGSAVTDKWLVVLSDGEFNDRDSGGVQADLERFVTENATESQSLTVAFLAIGDAAPALTDKPEAGVHFRQALDTADTLDRVTELSNLIFGRSILPQDSGVANPDIDLEELIVFAQGNDVTVDKVTAADGTHSAIESMEVKWAANDRIEQLSGSNKTPVPNEDLEGILSVYREIPAGKISVETTNASDIELFYKPKVNFGVQLVDADGRVVSQEKTVAGEYTLNYGFMNQECKFIESPLFGEPVFKAAVTGDGVISDTDIAPGDQIALSDGEAEIKVRAEFLEGSTTEATLNLKVHKAARETGFVVEPHEFQASKLNDYTMPTDAQVITFEITEAGIADELKQFTEAEWAEFAADTFTATSSEKNIEFEVEKGSEVGQVLLLPIAPDGDIYAAPTGDVPVTLSALGHLQGELYEAELETNITIEDDIPFLERFAHWFKEIGWLWLLGLLLLIWLLGYVFRRKLPKAMKEFPLISYTPKKMSAKPAQYDGKVTRSLGRTLIPYVPQTGTIKYVPPHAAGFSQLQVKAAGGGTMAITNWKNVAKRENIEINGEKLTKETTKAPILRAQHSITAYANEGTYETTLNSTKRGKR